MKTLLILFLLITGYAHASKTYTVTVEVYSLGTKEPLTGITIQKRNKIGKQDLGVTDSNGEFTLTEEKEKYFSCNVFDPNGIYEGGYASKSNYDRENITVQIYLRWSIDVEKLKFAERDAKYPLTVLNEDPSNVEIRMEDPNDINVEAEYIGGTIEMIKFVQMNMEYPAVCVQKNIQGKVFVTFNVENDGTVTHVKVEKSVHPDLDKEAIRVICYMPKWKPGSINGKLAKTRVRMPIPFSLR